MKNVFFLNVALFTIFLSGCVGSMPQTAEEFRLALPGAFMGKVETFEVNRPFRKVARTFKKMAPKCLDVRIKTTSSTYQSYQVIVTKWNPTVLVTKNKAELHIQQVNEKGVLNVYKEHEKGHFVMVVDAIPLDKKRTKIVMYRPSMGQDALVKAIKGWAAGKNVGCPDLSK